MKNGMSVSRRRINVCQVIKESELFAYVGAASSHVVMVVVVVVLFSASESKVRTCSCRMQSVDLDKGLSTRRCTSKTPQAARPSWTLDLGPDSLQQGIVSEEQIHDDGHHMTGSPLAPSNS